MGEIVLMLTNAQKGKIVLGPKTANKTCFSVSPHYQ